MTRPSFCPRTPSRTRRMRRAACYTARILNEERRMPIVRISIWPGRTHAQKAELAQAITDAVVKIAKTTPEGTIVIFEEVAREDWAVAGRLASDPPPAAKI